MRPLVSMNTGRPFSGIVKASKGPMRQTVALPRATKVLATRMAKRDRLPLSLVIAAAVKTFSERRPEYREAASLSLVGGRR